MGRIGKRKRKGRPPLKPDLARRGRVNGRDSRSPKSEADLRRSTRRRNEVNLTYIGDFYDDDDFDDEEEAYEEEEEVVVEEVKRKERKEKKLKLVVKIPHGRGGRRVDSVSRTAADYSSSSSSDADNDDKPFKKRKMDEEEGEEEEEEEEKSGGSEEKEEKKKKKQRGRNGDLKERILQQRDRNGDSEEKVLKHRGRIEDSKEMDSVPGTPSESQSGFPLPDKKELEFILDKLQKKDTYGVYAEPVDPEELPDYHDVIEHPMDFGTIRKKLANGKYSDMEQLENDVFLVCSNAMQYNAPETVYFKQARAIQELARKKFQMLRAEIGNSAEELKSEQNLKLNSVIKKPIKKSPCKATQEPVGSDFSSGATLATTRDISTLSNMVQVGSCERPSNVDGRVEGNGNSSFTESKAEKAEEQLSGKGFNSKPWRKPPVVDENRRATYNISNQSLVKDESMTTIFEGENKQLLPVGIHAEHSYARSLARFAATLGPIAWNVASRRIQQALPVGYKFGRGWVGEYEPLITPVVMVGNLSKKQQSMHFPVVSGKEKKTAEGLKVGQRDLPNPGLTTENRKQKHQGTQLQTEEARKDGKTGECLKVGDFKRHTNPVLFTANHKHKQTGAECKTTKSIKDERVVEELKASEDDVRLGTSSMNLSGMTASIRSQSPAKERNFVGPISQGIPGSFGVTGAKPSVNAMHQKQNPSTMDFMRSENNVLKKAEFNRSLTLTSGSPNDDALRKQFENSSAMTSSGLLEMISRNKGLTQPVTMKQPESNGIVPGGLPNGKGVSSYSHNQQMSRLPYNFVSNQQPRAGTFFSPGHHEQGLSDPVKMMRMLAEKAQNQQKSSMLGTTDPQITSSDQSSKRDDSSGVASAAARAWMTLGAVQFKSPDTSGPSKMQIAAASLYNSAREVPQTVPQYHEETSVSGRQLQSEIQRLPPQVFLQQPAHVGNEPRFQNNRPVVVPQMVTSDFTRFQMQSPWQGLVPHTQPNKKQDILPPDLNVSFQSSGSPVRQSSGIMVDSQQPDLALQL